MPTTTVTTHDPDGNVVDERTIEVPERPEEAAEAEFRAAIEAATSVADLKAALLGTNTKGRPVVRPT